MKEQKLKKVDSDEICVTDVELPGKKLIKVGSIATIIVTFAGLIVLALVWHEMPTIDVLLSIFNFVAAIYCIKSLNNEQATKPILILSIILIGINFYLSMVGLICPLLILIGSIKNFKELKEAGWHI